MSLNLLPVLVSAVAVMIIGAFWYSPLLFGNTWMKEVGLSKESLAKAQKAGMGKEYALQFLAGLVMVFILSKFLGGDLAADLKTALWIWLGFTAAKSVGSVLWEGRSWKLYAINVGADFANTLVATLILSSWM